MFRGAANPHAAKGSRGTLREYGKPSFPAPSQLNRNHRKSFLEAPVARVSARAPLARHALVIGSGMAGLAAAAALAMHFENVTVVERDELPPDVSPRKGTPQDKHVHGLLAGGQYALESLLPGFEQDFVSRGAVPYRAGWGLCVERPGHDPHFPRRDLGWTLYLATRPLLEFTVRQRVEALPNVKIRPGCRVIEITATPDGRQVTGLRCECPGNAIQTCAADLVVDASGRGAPTLGLLRSVGLPEPEESHIGVDLHYATAEFAVPKGWSADWKMVLTAGPVPQEVSALAEMEGGRWLVTLTGRGEQRPPADRAGYLAYARGLYTQTIHDAIKDAEPLTGIARFGIRESVWRHFERLPLPRGLLPIGDAICRLNPIHGKGMSVAAIEAHLLHQVLAARADSPDPLDNLAEALLSEAQPLIETAWNMAALRDFSFPGTRGTRPDDLEDAGKLFGALDRLSARDAGVHKLMLQVSHLMRPPSVFDDPALVRRVKAEIAAMERERTAAAAGTA